jgi:hypothetical protein
MPEEDGGYKYMQHQGAFLNGGVHFFTFLVASSRALQDGVQGADLRRPGRRNPS